MEVRVNVTLEPIMYGRGAHKHIMCLCGTGTPVEMAAMSAQKHSLCLCGVVACGAQAHMVRMRQREPHSQSTGCPAEAPPVPLRASQIEHTETRVSTVSAFARNRI